MIVVALENVAYVEDIYNVVSGDRVVNKGSVYKSEFRHPFLTLCPRPVSCDRLHCSLTFWPPPFFFL